MKKVFHIAEYGKRLKETCERLYEKMKLKLKKKDELAAMRALRSADVILAQSVISPRSLLCRQDAQRRRLRTTGAGRGSKKCRA
jgi:hypothetical protein